MKQSNVLSTEQKEFLKKMKNSDFSALFYAGLHIWDKIGKIFANELDVLTFGAISLNSQYPS